MKNALRASEGGEVLYWQALNRETLYDIYMPFVEGGGFFIATNKEYHLGDHIHFIATLLDEPETATLAATVVWSTGRHGLQYQRGVGVQLLDSVPALTSKIEACLAVSNLPSTPSFTL